MTTNKVFLDQLQDGGGDLVNVSSVAGRVAPAGFAAYAATKWGINGANKTATAEMGIPAPDIADVIAFAVGRPQRVTLNEILVRPTVQAM